MDKRMELLLLKLDEKLNKQTKLITEQNIDIGAEREKTKFKLVFFGVEDNGKLEAELVDYLKDTVIETGIHLDSQEISNIYRIGKKKMLKTALSSSPSQHCGKNT
ncbi:unnamed protein product [Euphydryas editha]|uniref:Uncharacterized protein n=1 Tax=Euphydryas editha TaxID=104508 RepID=A0AAU9UT50_EUPED|nr:unnamed protein product [Euphydryas editha]